MRELVTAEVTWPREAAMAMVALEERLVSLGTGAGPGASTVRRCCWPSVLRAQGLPRRTDHLQLRLRRRSGQHDRHGHHQMAVKGVAEARYQAATGSFPGTVRVERWRMRRMEME